MAVEKAKEGFLEMDKQTLIHELDSLKIAESKNKKKLTKL